MKHIVLFGDSIFDNKAYTKGGPAVIEHLRGMLAKGDLTTLLAVDGDHTIHIGDQLKQLKFLDLNPTHMVLSVGGNDALGYAYMLEEQASSVAEVLARFSEAAAGFEQDYRKAVDALLKIPVPLILCTIYNGNFDAPGYQQLATAALCFFNDVILRVAMEYTLPVIDLRQVCNTPEDYGNPIEPSAQGGFKIAQRILDQVIWSSSPIDEPPAPEPQLFRVEVVHKKRPRARKRWVQRYAVIGTSHLEALDALRKGGALFDRDKPDEVNVKPEPTPWIGLGSGMRA